MDALPWEQHLPQVTFHHNGADARLVASHGASFASVYVACSCPICENRPLAAFRTGGCVLGLGDWALHVGLKAASLAEVQVIQPESNEKVSAASRGSCVQPCATCDISCAASFEAAIHQIIILL